MSLTDFIKFFTDIGLLVIPLMATIAFLAFVLAVGRYIRASGNEKELKDSKNLLIWGVIGLFVLTSIWGIIAFLRSELGFGSDTVVPQILRLPDVKSEVKPF